MSVMLEVAIHRSPRESDLEEIEKVVGKKRYRDTPGEESHFLVFFLDTEEEGKKAESRLLDLENVLGTNLDPDPGPEDEV